MRGASHLGGVAISRLRVSLDRNPNRNRNPNRMLAIGIAVLVSIVSMLVGLIRHTSAHRVYEQHAEYNAKPTKTED